MDDEKVFTEYELRCIFGPESTGDTFEEREKTSTQLWVRSQDHLAIYNAERKPTGLTLTPREVYELFGWEMIDEACWYSSAILPKVKDEPSGSIRRCREKKGWTQEELAKRAEIPLEEVLKVEDRTDRTTIQMLKKMCDALEIDWRVITF